MNVEMIADYACETGENPLWHPDEGKLYWIDIPAGRMFRFDAGTGEHQQCYEGEVVGGFTLQADGGLLLFMDRGSVRTWSDGLEHTIVEEIPRERDSRFNDVIADPAGRVFCGTMSTDRQKGRLYRLDADGSLTVVLEGIGTSNGMGFTPDRSGFYHTDSRRGIIYRYDYDVETGAISNRRVVVRREGNGGRPDGMTVDAEGLIWSAQWDGGMVMRFTPDGEEVDRAKLPARKVSCPTFGGDDYGDLYVTTAGGDRKEEEGEGAGALFRLRPEVGGVPEFRSKVGL